VWRALTVTTSALVFAGCATGRIARSLRPLPVCVVERVGSGRSDWHRHDVSHGFTLELPPECGPTQDAPTAVHGASRWSCGSVTVSVYWGMWGENPSDEPRPCRARAGGLPIVVTRDGSGAQEAVWCVTGDIHEPRVAVSGASAADWPIVLGITRSGAVFGGP